MDSRLHPNRPGPGRRHRLSVPFAGLHREPNGSSMQVTQALMGEPIRVFDDMGEWRWCQLARDGYVGYLPEHALSADAPEPTHRICVPSTFLYPKPDLKSQPAAVATLNAEVTVMGDEGGYRRLADGRYVFGRHLKPADQHDSDFVAIAEMFLCVPYLWGGKSAIGLDCSGLVQLALEACGIASRRDSDMQEAEFGEALPAGSLDGLRRGDLVFWDGHVGIMTDADTLLHANGFHMQVVREPLRRAIERIAAKFGKVTSIRRRALVLSLGEEKGTHRAFAREW